MYVFYVRDALHQWHAPILYSVGSPSADILVGLQWSMQHVSNTLFWRFCWYFLPGKQSLMFLIIVVWIASCYTHIHVLHLLQMEATVPFFMGILDLSDTYCDNIKVVAIKYLTSTTGFWFDFTTSLPWSMYDLYTYQVWLQYSNMKVLHSETESQLYMHDFNHFDHCLD